eukprot:3267359-Rhodomonas_salina.1
MTAVEMIQQTVLTIWSWAPTTAILPEEEPNCNGYLQSGELEKLDSHVKEDSEQGPFQDTCMN